MAEEHISNRLKRAFIFIEDGNWSRADEYLEEVLDYDATCALAYIGKMMIELEIEGVEELQKYANYIDENKNFKRAVRYADADLKMRLEILRQDITNNAEYSIAKTAAENVETLEQAQDCLKKFLALRDRMDVEDEIKEQKLKVERLDFYKRFILPKFHSVPAEECWDDHLDFYDLEAEIMESGEYFED